MPVWGGGLLAAAAIASGAVAGVRAVALATVSSNARPLGGTSSKEQQLQGGNATVAMCTVGRIAREVPGTLVLRTIRTYEFTFQVPRTLLDNAGAVHRTRR
jgi:lipid-binding SYLF domain-containing protein